MRGTLRVPCSRSPPPHLPPTLSYPTTHGRMTSYNPALGLRGLSVPASPRRAGTRCDIGVDEAVGAPARYRYMYTPLEERAASLEKGLLSLQVRVLSCRFAGSCVGVMYRRWRAVRWGYVDTVEG